MGESDRYGTEPNFFWHENCFMIVEASKKNDEPNEYIIWNGNLEDVKKV